MFSSWRIAEFDFLGFLIPWELVMGFIGFFAAWGVVVLLERYGLTNRIWHLPLFFISLAILLGCLTALLLMP